MSVDLVTTEFRVPGDPGIELYVRNRHRADLGSFSSERTVLFVHGATYPAESSFDLQLDGLSWMDYVAQHGHDVYLMDIRGYGRSTRPPRMDRPANESQPFAGADEAVRDIAAVVDFIRARRGIDRLILLAWSWGTATCQMYTIANNDKVERLVLHAPLWIRRTPSPLSSGDGPLGAYRSVDMAQARRRWLAGVPPDQIDQLIPPGWFEAWASATQASDPVGAQQTPPVVRAPNGVVQDLARQAECGRMDWDPAEIRVPVLLIKAEWDQDTPAHMAQELFSLLVNAPSKRYTELGGGTHMVLLERRRMDLFREVQRFLDEPQPAST